MARLLAILIFASLLAGCGKVGPASSPAPKVVRATAAPLRQIQLQQTQLLDGGAAAFKRRLAALRSFPVVVNQWASWCPPCRYEFPFFQRVAARYGNRVAFLGVDAADNRGEARTFLGKFPT